VAFALDAEFAPWRRRGGFRRAAPSAGGCFEAAVAGVSIRAAIVGIGGRRLRAAEGWLFDPAPDALIVAGLAGGLSPTHRVGDVLAARYVCREESSHAADPHLIDLAARCGARPVDRFVSVDAIVATVAARRRLAASGDAVDMESAAVLEAARRRNIAAVALRVIGDAADDDLPLDFGSFIRGDGTIASFALAAAAVGSPMRWRRLLRFAADQRRALHRLATVLDRMVVQM
jgi:nucleoside phosphorylase